jgi:rhamnogalacturonyl hydrolase YesR
LLGAAFLSRLYSITKDDKLLDCAIGAVKFSINRQNADGSWFYGENETQRWIDNFHTGYNLVALNKFYHYTGNRDFIDNMKEGFKFYINNFFSENGPPKYYHNRSYPIDIHCVAQSIITLIELDAYDATASDRAVHVCKWAIENMQNKKGFFFYQQKRFFKNRTSYMRWSQAWMLLALSTLLEYFDYSGNNGV